MKVEPSEQYPAAQAQLGALLSRVIDSEVQLRVAAVRQEVAEAERRRRGGQPSAEELMRALYRAFELKVREPNPGTFVGGAKLVKDVAAGLGVLGAEELPYLRRTRAQVDKAPSHRGREGSERTADVLAPVHLETTG